MKMEEFFVSEKTNNKFMKKYTVEKPEYDDVENSEVLFDAIFGNSPSESDNDKVVV